MTADPTITPVGSIAPRSNSGSISFTCSASSIIHAGGVPARRSSDEIGTSDLRLGFARVDKEAFPHDRRRHRPQLRRLDPPQDQLGVGLADAERSHAPFIGKTSAPDKPSTRGSNRSSTIL